MKPYTT